MYEIVATQNLILVTLIPTPDTLAHSPLPLDPLQRPKPSFPDPEQYNHSDKTLYP